VGLGTIIISEKDQTGVNEANSSEERETMEKSEWKKKGRILRREWVRLVKTARGGNNAAEKKGGSKELV